LLVRDVRDMRASVHHDPRQAPQRDPRTGMFAVCIVPASASTRPSASSANAITRSASSAAGTAPHR
jgi:hypothetical protein